MTVSLTGAISPLDGRYAQKVGHLGRWFSEEALVGARLRVELAVLRAQDATGLWRPLSAEESARCDELERSLGPAEVAEVKAWEARVNHDVKACELFLRDRLQLRDPERIHFGLTSEDVNNLAWSTLLDGYRVQDQIPTLVKLLSGLAERARRWRDVPFPAHTHGQLASPTTAGKELVVPLSRLLRFVSALGRFRFAGKLNGATGNYSAMLAAAPQVDWPAFGRRVVEGMGLRFNPVTTQIEDHDRWAEYLDLTRRIGNIVLDLDRDLWAYISRGLIRQESRAGEVGSSTMPHKVNPIRFENSEGNLETALPLLAGLADKLTRSRMQRDLSDSTATRNIGVALAHVHLAIMETTGGLTRLDVDAARAAETLDGAPELLAEPIQTILRMEGVANPYDLLKARTRGQRVSREELLAVSDGLDISEEARARIQGLVTREYLGLAREITDGVLRDAEETLAGLSGSDTEGDVS